MKILQSAGAKKADIIGFVFAINGKLNSADIYSSNGLFRKMWPKLLRASVTEAIAEKGRSAGLKPPSMADVRAFFKRNNQAIVKTTRISSDIQLETSVLDKAYFFATKRANGRVLHFNYLAKD